MNIHRTYMYMYMYDATVYCKTTRYTIVTTIHYCVEEEECGGLKEGR